MVAARAYELVVQMVVQLDWRMATIGAAGWVDSMVVAKVCERVDKMEAM